MKYIGSCTSRCADTGVQRYDTALHQLRDLGWVVPGAKQSVCYENYWVSLRDSNSVHYTSLRAVATTETVHEN